MTLFQSNSMCESAEERPCERCMASLGVQNLLVQLADLPGHLFVTESLSRVLLPRPAQPLSECFIVSQFRDSSGQGLDAAWLEKDPCFIRDDDFTGPIYVVADDRFAGQ